MTKVVINTCYGGFSLSNWALQKLGREYSFDIPRDDPELVAVVEEDAKKASGNCASLKVVEIPDGNFGWYLSDYDGCESIHENHRSWS